MREPFEKGGYDGTTVLRDLSSLREMTPLDGSASEAAKKHVPCVLYGCNIKNTQPLWLAVARSP
jgi:hypothetical protein